MSINSTALADAQVNGAIDAQVMVVDDEEYFASTLGDILQDYGYTVLTATSGECALKMLRNCRPRLLLLDLRMTGMSGEELCRRLAAKPAAPAIVILTAQTDEQQLARLYALGVLEVLPKPVSIHHLLHLVALCCGQPPARVVPTAARSAVSPEPLEPLQPV